MRPTHRALVVASAAALALGLFVAPASGDRPEPPGPAPSRAEVQQAEAAAQEAANSVAVIQADLAVANAELEASAMRAAQAFEAYNGARWAADQAAEQLRQAMADARRAARQLARQREQLASLVAVSYQDAGELSAVEAVLGAEGPAGLMDQLVTYEGASASLDAQLQKFAATADLAEVFRNEAEQARAEKLRLLEEAEAARETAAAAAAAAQALADSIAEQKADLVAELARLQGISVQLAERRQSALEERQRQRAAEEAAREAELAARTEVEEQAGEEQAPPAEPTPDPLPEPQPQPESETRSEPDPEPEPAPAPPPVDATPPAPAGGAAAALAFARGQVGEPYVWGAAGPDSWDCSGLTMAAWRTGGVALPHYSVAQYDASTPITAGQLRPGDLVFWGSSSSPTSIFHVALYAGDGMIIHAPRTGRPVTVDSMYYWVPPTFFGRV